MKRDRTKHQDTRDFFVIRERMREARYLDEHDGRIIKLAVEFETAAISTLPNRHGARKISTGR